MLRTLLRLLACLTCAACAPAAPVAAPVTPSGSATTANAPAPATTSSTGPASASREDVCLAAARACGAAFAAHDYGRLVDCMPSEAFDAFPNMGGREGFRAAAEKGVQQMAADGVTIESVEYGRPHDFIAAGAHLFAVVPEVLTMKVPQGHLVAHDFMLAVSRDAGASWKFIAGPFAKKASSRIFPDFPAELKLPEIPKPVLGP